MASKDIKDPKDKANKFKPIFEAIKQQDLRTALRLCDRKEISQLPLAKALKAQCLFMSGYGADAREFALQSVSKTRSGPVVEPAALTAACKVLVRVGETSEAIRAYEDAVAAAPESEALGRGLCLALARSEDWKKMQAAAMRLYGKHPKPVYMAWAALAVHLTAGQTDADSSKAAPNPATGGGRGLGTSRLSGAAAMPLMLSERMLAKALDECTDPEGRDADSLGLYLHSLLRQGKAGEAYAALMGKYAYLPPTGTDAPSSTGDEPSASEEEQDEEDAEAVAESAAEDASGISVLPDGRGGRGRVPGPLQPGDQLRYAAQLLAFRAAWGPAQGEPVPLVVPAPGKPEWVAADATGGAAVGSWSAARNAFGALLTTIDASAGEWDIHAGLAYCWARDAAATLSTGSAGSVESLLAPVIDGQGGLRQGVTGVAGVDALLAIHTKAALSSTTNSPAAGVPPSPVAGAAEGGAEATLNTQRACLTALILHQALRCELAHRLVAAGGPHADAARTALSQGTAAYVRLIAAFVRLLGTRPAVFSDLRTLLTPLARTVPAGTGGATSAPVPDLPTGPSTGSAAGLAAFLAEEPTLLSLPYHPIGAAGSASETAPVRPLFSWSFSVGSGDVDAHLLSLLTTWRETCRPGEDLSNAVKAVLAAGRAAAVEAGLVDKTDVMLRTRDVRGATGGPPKYDPRNPPAEDPHGVAHALSARDEFVFTPEHKASLASARATIRQYTTAMQLLRFLGRTDLTGLATGAAGGATPTPSTAATNTRIHGGAAALPGEHALRAVANELACAWEHTLHLLAASPVESKDLGEGDDLLLLATHSLWDLSWAHAHARDAALGTGTTMAFGGPLSASSVGKEGEASVSHLYAARGYMLEASCLLAAAAAHSPHNAQIRLALVRTYGWLAAPSAVLYHANALRLRSISLETLSHVSYLPFVRGYWPTALSLDRTMAGQAQLVRFLSQSATERREYVRTALRVGNVASAADLARMSGRLEYSASGAWARAVNLAHEVHNRAGKALQDLRVALYAGVNQPETPLYSTDAPGVFASLRDNEDREVMSNWSQPSGLPLLEARAGGLSTIATLANSKKAYTTAATADAALALFSEVLGSGSSPVANARCELTGWISGSAGATSERLLRRATREIMITTQTEIAKALLYGLHILGTDGTPSGAKAALDRLAGVLAVAGCAVPGAAGGVTGDPTPHITTCSTITGALEASAKEVAGSAAPGSSPAASSAGHELRLALLSDWAVGSIPVVDTGLSAERPALRVAAGVALWRALAALAALCDAAVSTLPVSSQIACVNAATGHLRIAGALAGAVLTEVAGSTYEPGPTPTTATGTPSETTKPATTAIGTAAIPAPHACVTGVGSTATSTASTSSGGGGGVRAAWVPESALAVHHMGAPVVIALAGIARHLAALSKDAGKGKAAKGGKKGGDKGEEKEGATSTAIMEVGLAPSLANAQAALQEAITTISAGLTALKTASKGVYGILEQAMPVSILLVSAGFDVGACATGTVSSMRPEIKAGETIGKGGAKGGKAAAKTAASTGSTEDAPPSEPGARFVHTLSTEYRKLIRTGAIEEVLTHLGGAYTLTVQDIEEACATRLATLKQVAAQIAKA